jgi:DmsE family decaheme c-type cytochrome
MKKGIRIAGVGALVLGYSLAISSVAVNRVSAASAAQTRAAEGVQASDAECLTCHGAGASKPAVSILQTRHGNTSDSRTPACRDCHGASETHIKAPSSPADVVFGGKAKSVSSSEQRSAACLTCHESKVLPRANWAGSQHQSRGIACSDCHNVHAPDQKVLSRATQADVCFGCHKAQRAQMRRVSAHPLATTGLADTAKMACSDCHNPHGSTGPKLLVKNSVNDTCFTCHAEKRGPYLWEHAPVADDCTNCHTPHGSSNAPLLKARVPWLCQDCHSGDHAAQINSGANLAGASVTTVNGAQQAGAAAPRAQLAARACLNCHVLIHGSNHPAGAKFQR